jgi:hypothetical protein
MVESTINLKYFKRLIFDNRWNSIMKIEIVEIITANNPVREPEIMIENKINHTEKNTKRCSNLFDFIHQNMPIGKSKDKTATNPAGLSKLPVTAKEL